ncbi:MAG: type II secretion system F family protein [Ignavibacteriales bacterium]|nr:type II secretion system F family protein [Ignavibacteriales bacterium]
MEWPTTRKIIDKLVLEIPIFSNFAKLAQLSNFVSILKVSFEAGIPIFDGITLANRSITNYKLKESLKEATVKIQQGQSLSNSLKATNVVPGVVMCMVATGEESGQLSDTLEYAEIYIEKQLEYIVEILNKLFEPFLLIIIGGIVLILGLALYLPLFQSYSSMM